MNLQESQKKHIRSAFKKIKTKSDFLYLLNYSKKIVYGEKTKPFELKHITYHSNPNINSSRYYQFSIKKKSGGVRTINAPNKGLKSVQKCLNLIFQTIYDVSPDAFGFVPNKSIVNNAGIHAGSLYVYNIDLKDFFSSIDQARVWGRMQHPPFNLKGTNDKIEVANIIAALCCQEILVERLDGSGNWQKVLKNVLPQGAPTSPTITNIICQSLDFYLGAASKKFGVKYSRYADDITFSSSHNIYQADSDFVAELKRIITSQNFAIKESKTRLQKTDFKQEVTGLVVNEKPNVSKRYIKELRQWLYYWEHYGYAKANEYFAPRYIADKGDKNQQPNLKNVLGGKLDFLKMVKGGNDSTYAGLSKRFTLLKEMSSEQPGQEIKNDAEQIKNITPTSILTFPVIHTPKVLVSILKRFSINKSALKFATHSWDAGQDEAIFSDYSDFIKKAKKEFDKISLGLNDLSPQLRAKILSFLFNENVKEQGWGMHRIKFGWSSPELKEEMIDNTKKPENFILPLYAQFQLKTKQGIQTIQKFKQVIDIFKNEIEVRDENSALEELILDFHDKYLHGFTIKEFTNLENKNFYTDIDYLTKVFDLVFENIKKRKFFPEVSYRVIENGDSYTLSILHNRSTVRGLSLYDEKFSLEKGDFGTIKTRLNNLCDWSIQTEFQEGAYQLNYLSSDPLSPSFQKIEKAEGFNYLFTFYK